MRASSLIPGVSLRPRNRFGAWREGPIGRHRYLPLPDTSQRNVGCGRPREYVGGNRLDGLQTGAPAFVRERGTDAFIEARSRHRPFHPFHIRGIGGSGEFPYRGRIDHGGTRFRRTRRNARDLRHVRCGCLHDTRPKPRLGRIRVRPGNGRRRLHGSIRAQIRNLITNAPEGQRPCAKRDQYTQHGAQHPAGRAARTLRRRCDSLAQRDLATRPLLLFQTTQRLEDCTHPTPPRSA